MTLIATPLTVGPATLVNRLVVAPMCMYSAREGVITPFHEQHVGRLALSGAGLVILEATGVTAQGRISDGCPGLWNDEQEAAFAALLSRVRTYADTPLALQIGHAGRKASTHAPWTNGGAPLSVANGAWGTVAPSAVAFNEGWPQPRAMDRQAMDEVTAAFVDAARRADRAGFDGLELHAAHGYLLSAFLSPVANHRDDDYGGALENRMRFPLEVARAVRAVWPAGKMLGVRFNGSDWDEDGITPEEAAIFGRAMHDAGYDWLHVSSGGNAARARISAQSAYQLPFARAVKAASPGATVIGVGLIKTAQQAEAALQAKDADLISVGRAVLDNPNWPHHAIAELAGTEALPRQYERAGLAWRSR